MLKSHNTDTNGFLPLAHDDRVSNGLARAAVTFAHIDQELLPMVE